MLLAARASFAISRARRWTNPYVTDGLIAMWDAIWNAGPDVHDPNATTWKNLVENSSFSDGLRSSNTPVWGDDYCRNTKSVGQTQVFAVTATAATAQSIAYVEEVGRAVSVPETFEDSSWNLFQRFAMGVAFFRSSGLQLIGNLVLWPSGKYQPWRTSNGNTALMDTSVRRSYHSKRAPSDRMYMRINGDTEYLYTRGNGSTLSIPASYPLLAAKGCVLEANCIRLYSRVLSSEETAANDAVDRARFNL